MLKHWTPYVGPFFVPLGRMCVNSGGFFYLFLLLFSDFAKIYLNAGYSIGTNPPAASGSLVRDDVWWRGKKKPKTKNPIFVKNYKLIN